MQASRRRTTTLSTGGEHAPGPPTGDGILRAPTADALHCLVSLRHRRLIHKLSVHIYRGRSQTLDAKG